jgi:hypothetical protein
MYRFKFSFLSCLLVSLVSCHQSGNSDTTQEDQAEAQSIISLAEVLTRIQTDRATVDSSSQRDLLIGLKKLSEYHEELYDVVAQSDRLFRVSHLSARGVCCPCSLTNPHCCTCQQHCFASVKEMNAMIQVNTMRGDTVAINRQQRGGLDLFFIESLPDGEYTVVTRANGIPSPITMSLTVKNGAKEIR